MFLLVSGRHVGAPSGWTPEIFVYSRSSRKRSPREFEQVVVTRAGRLQEYALVSDQKVKQWRMVAYGSFTNSALFGRNWLSTIQLDWGEI